MSPKLVFRQVGPEEGVFYKGFVQCSAGGRGRVGRGSQRWKLMFWIKRGISPASLVLI